MTDETNNQAGGYLRPARSATPRHPNYLGEVYVDGHRFLVAGWDNGTDVISLRLTRSSNWRVNASSRKSATQQAIDELCRTKGATSVNYKNVMKLLNDAGYKLKKQDGVRTEIRDWYTARLGSDQEYPVFPD